MTNDKKVISDYERPRLLNRMTEKECFDSIDSIKTMRELVS